MPREPGASPPGIDSCESQTLKARFNPTPEGIAIFRVETVSPYRRKWIALSTLVILESVLLGALPEAAVESDAVGAQNLKLENCFASRGWIVLCSSTLDD
jgi:hypothetical protein